MSLRALWKADPIEGSVNVAGEFLGLPEGSRFIVGSTTFFITYKGGKDGQTGVGVVEVFDVDSAAPGSRGFVDVDDNVMIAGLIVAPTGGTSINVLVRALGPTLGDFGVQGFLANPTLDLVSSNGTVIRSNQDWKDSQRAAIEAAQRAPAHDAESALIESLAPGAYTAIVRGLNRTTGVGLVEVYNIP